MAEGALIRLDVAEHALAEANTIDRVGQVCGFFDGIRKVALKTKNRDAEIRAVEFHFRAQRKLGELITAAAKADALAKGGRPHQKTYRVKNNPVEPTLAGAGVDKNTAHSARQLGRLKPVEFKERLQAWRQSVDENDDGGRIPTKLPEPPREEVAAKTRANTVSLKEWETLSLDEQREFLQPHNFPTDSQFNKQEGDGIEWAQWSWNPVVGCRHDCPYCYARDIAERYPDAYPHAFEPAFRPYMLNAPGNTKLPDEAAADTRFKNVFTCSMADLFGRWVPRSWIEAVLTVVREQSQWNFLFLTKFPKRMAEFDIPENAWMGTTVDLQRRVANAEAAFARLNSDAGVRWLSVEPMLEPIKFERLDLFDWVVIGGAARSNKTPKFHPPLPWIIDLYTQAKAAGCAVYMKTNLLGSRVLELPFDAPIKGDPSQAPSELHYLGSAA